MSSWVGWMKWQGSEIANANRIVSYLENGLGCSTGISLSGEGCECDAIDEGPYVDPATDEAPWYVAVRPESADFLGVFLTEIQLGSPYGRVVTPASMGGSILGPQRVRGRTISFSGILVADSPPGLEYGRRWIAQALQSCDLGNLCLLPACPGEGIDMDAAEGFRTLKRVGLINGPTEVQIGDQRDLVTSFEWQMASEVGYLYEDPQTCLDDQVLVDEECCILSTEEWIGDATAKITVESGSNGYVSGVRVLATPTKNGVCPATGTATPCSDFTIYGLPPGASLVVDGAERTVEVRQSASGTPIGGLDVIVPAEGIFQFVDVGACSQVCVCVSVEAGGAVNADTKVSVEQFNREV